MKWKYIFLIEPIRTYIQALNEWIGHFYMFI